MGQISEAYKVSNRLRMARLLEMIKYCSAALGSALFATGAGIVTVKDNPTVLACLIIIFLVCLLGLLCNIAATVSYAYAIEYMEIYLDGNKEYTGKVELDFQEIYNQSHSKHQALYLRTTRFLVAAAFLLTVGACIAFASGILLLIKTWL